MNRRLGLAVLAVAALALAACQGRTGGGGASGGSNNGSSGGEDGPKIAVTPSYTQFRSVKVCEAVPQEKVEKIVGATVSRPAEEYTIESRDVACWYPFGRRDSKPVYVIISIGPTLMYQFNRENKVNMLADSGLGDEAYTRISGDREELWVLLNGQAAVIVGMVDFDLEQATELAKLGIGVAPKE